MVNTWTTKMFRTFPPSGHVFLELVLVQFFVVIVFEESMDQR